MMWRTARWAHVLLATAVGLMAILSVEGQEPAGEFLEQLRDKGYFEEALNYLERVPQSGLFSDDFKSTVDFQRGLTLFAFSRTQRDRRLRTQNLDQAKAAFDAFIQQHGTHPFALQARTELANVLVERADILVEQFKKEQDRALLTEASAIYDQALAAFKASEEVLREELKGMTISATDGDGLEQRAKLRDDFVRTRLLGVAVLETKATETLPQDDAERTKLLTAAAAAYEDIYNDYSKTLGGVYARIYQARCMQKLGRQEDALTALQDFLDQSDDSMRTLKALALGMALDSWIQLNQSAEAAQRALDWVDRARPVEAKAEPGLKIHYFGALAVNQMAQTLAAQKPRDPQVAKLRKQARQMATLVATQAGDYREGARTLLAAMGNVTAEETQTPLPDTFGEALQAGKEAMDSIRTSQMLEEMLPDRLAAESDPQNRQALQQQLDAATANVESKQVDAQRLFQRALDLANSETPIDDVNTALYYLCYLRFLARDYYAAAVLGDFVGRRYPSSAGARVCARIAMGSYYALFQEQKEAAEGGDGPPASSVQFFAQHAQRAAAFIADTWPGSSEADEALGLLIPLLISDGKLQEARAALDKIPADSAKRGAAELSTGQAMWSAYIQGLKDSRAAGVTEEPAQLQALKEGALNTLSAGVQRMRGRGPNKVLSVSTLALAQLLIDTNQAAQAVELLEDPEIGPLTLLKKGDAAMDQQDLTTEAYKTALRGYLAALGSDAGSLEKARSLMNQLKQQLPAPDLMRLYYGLARDLQQQVEIAPPQQRDALVGGFRSFLQQVTSEANEFPLLTWVGNTLFELGENLGTDQQRTPAARELYNGAEEAYAKILDLAQANPEILPTADHGIAVRQRLAETRRRLGRYSESLDVLEAILKEKNALLPVQVAAAETLQEWADQNVQAAQAIELYNQAIKGSRLDRTQRPPRYTLWGWAGLANRTANRADFREQFHQARYNLALCRYSQAGKQADASGKTKVLELAKRDIQLTARLFPDLGGDQWRAQYDDLLKKIQRQLNQPTSGLQEFEVQQESSNTTPSR